MQIKKLFIALGIVLGRAPPGAQEPNKKWTEVKT